MNTVREKFIYSNLSWPEIRDLKKEELVVIQPIGAIEDHGPHLPLITDNLLISEICYAAAKRIPDDVLLMPLIPYGYDEHHLFDFPGTISIKTESLIGFLFNAVRSVTVHGFRKILIANGHGSNRPFIDIAARKVMEESDAIVASIMPYSLARKEISEICESKHLSHAEELETSLVLYLDESLVDTTKLVKDIHFPITKYHWRSLIEAPPLSFMDRWSRISKTGVVGDATLATKEKGEKLFSILVEKMVELIQEFKAREIRPAVNHHGP
jgi:creatinine amidohydrolase